MNCVAKAVNKLFPNQDLTEFHKIKATGHTFDITHPFEGSNRKFDFVLEKTLNFFNKNLN